MSNWKENNFCFITDANNCQSGILCLFNLDDSNIVTWTLEHTQIDSRRHTVEEKNCLYVKLPLIDVKTGHHFKFMILLRIPIVKYNNSIILIQCLEYLPTFLSILLTVLNCKWGVNKMKHIQSIQTVLILFLEDILTIKSW